VESFILVSKSAYKGLFGPMLLYYSTFFYHYRENGGVQFEIINLNSGANWYEDEKLGKGQCSIVSLFTMYLSVMLGVSFITHVFCVLLLCRQAT